MLPPNVVLPSPMLDVDAENVTPDVIALPPTVNIPVEGTETRAAKPPGSVTFKPVAGRT